MSRVNENLKVKRAKIGFIEEKCISCGACTALCPTAALCIDKGNWKLRFCSEKCSSCLLCVSSCPLGAIVQL
ncbi:4Fe-4S dicluster domain-containing protein [Caldanaerovirga acetigignens]|uniref:4Fe-4S dicluster domain-containing protein n=1 Tax=Caldanaerovirga acetigignens TaxID=447595 RepID=A0A1M7LSJ9_9FIRM|nr:4Fe-4S dicluster domain-containing protein [Caldanaerovirga acetigignens]